MSQIGSFPQNIMKPPPSQSMSICTSFFSTFPPQTLQAASSYLHSPLSCNQQTRLLQRCQHPATQRLELDWAFESSAVWLFVSTTVQQLLEFIDFCLSYQNTSIFVLYDTKSPQINLSQKIWFIPCLKLVDTWHQQVIYMNMKDN